MEVDTNELLHRIGAVLRGISDKMDRLIDIGERVEGEVRLPSKEEAQTVAVAKEPAKEPEPEYREPVLPADAGQYCQFSDDGIEWRSGWLNGWVQRSHQWISHSGGHWRHCRIKKDA